MAPPFLVAFADWLAETSLSLQIQSIAWLIPLVQTIHILSIALVLSSVGMIALRVVGLAGARTSIADTSLRYVPWIWCALVVLLITGTILIIGEPARSLVNSAFQWKMALLLLAIACLFGFQRTVFRNAPLWNHGPSQRPLAKILAVGVVALFMIITVLGRWIAYVIA